MKREVFKEVLIGIKEASVRYIKGHWLTVHTESIPAEDSLPNAKFRHTGEVEACSSDCTVSNDSGHVQFISESGEKGHVYRNWCERCLLVGSQQHLWGHMPPEFPCSHTAEQKEQIQPFNGSLCPWPWPSVDIYGWWNWKQHRLKEKYFRLDSSLTKEHSKGWIWRSAAING